MERDHLKLGSLSGVPIAMHWTVLLSCVWLFVFLRDVVATVIASITLLALFTAHELGHVALLRWRRVEVQSITLYGLHGRTAHEYTSHLDAGIGAWGGVLAQCVVLLGALIAERLTPLDAPHLVWSLLGPVFFVCINVNCVLILIALLPIGPFDGRNVWRGLPYVRKAIRRRVAGVRERKLSPEQLRALERKSKEEAAALLARISKKVDKSSEDA